MELTLASASPRRKELIKKLNINFKVVPSEIEEIIDRNLSPEQVAMSLSSQKAEDVFSRFGGTLIGVDTIVLLDNEILGKPKDENDAFFTLKKLSGNVHEVISGFTIINKDNSITAYDCTEVKFNKLTDEHIKKYLQSGLWKGKAGSYGIQDGYDLVEKYIGSFDNVVGFPTEKIAKVLKEFDTEKKS